jgi:hypothetical protein
MNAQEAAHRWAHDKYNRNGEIKAGNVYAYEHSRTIYSYGSHFPIATLTDNKEFPLLFTYRGYSNSTSKHISCVARASCHIPKFLCHSPANTPYGIYRHELENDLVERVKHHLELRGKVTYWEERIAKRAAAGKAPSDQNTECLDDAKNRVASAAVGIAERAAELERFRKAFGIKLTAISPTLRALRTKFLSDKWTAIPGELAAMAQKAEEKRRKEYAIQHAKQAAEEADKLVAWLNGDPCRLNYGFHTGAARLRVKDGEVQTNQGAVVPVDDAWKLWELVLRCRNRNKSFTPPPEVKVGYYQLNSVSAEGSVVIGCHRIHFDEMARIAPQVEAAVRTAQVAYDTLPVCG